MIDPQNSPEKGQRMKPKVPDSIEIAPGVDKGRFTKIDLKKKKPENEAYYPGH